jgi:putative tributyrin esterase
MFRTIEISDPALETDNLRWVTVKSRALRERADLTLFVPHEAAPNANLPLIILLHGVYGSHWAWPLKGGAHRTAASLIAAGEIPPLILAMPSDGLWGDGSGYLRHPHQDFERWILDEVPAAAQQAVPSLGSSPPLFVSGLSMGGFGALRLAGKYPEKFRAAGGHSSITRFEQFSQFVEEPLERYACPVGDESVLETLLVNRDRLPPLRFDCGTEDPLLEHNRELSRQLKRAGIAHRYEEFPGGHEWPYWQRHLADMLVFFASHL